MTFITEDSRFSFNTANEIMRRSDSDSAGAIKDKDFVWLTLTPVTVKPALLKLLQLKHQDDDNYSTLAYHVTMLNTFSR